MMNTITAMPAHIRPRLNVVPAESGAEPASTLFVYAITRPIATSRPAYVISCKSKARHAAPTDLAAQSLTRAGSARITPMDRARGSSVARRSSSVALVEVAALQELREPVILLDPEMELEVVLHDLSSDVADGPRVVGEREDHELRVGRVE